MIFTLAIVIIIAIIYFKKIDIKENVDETKNLTPFTFEYINSNKDNPDYSGLNNYVDIVFEEPEINLKYGSDKEDGTQDNKYSKVTYKIKFKNTTDEPISFYFYLFFKPEFADAFFDIDQSLKYNQENVLIKPGSRLGVTVSILVKNPELLNSEEKSMFYDEYKNFIGYFRVNGNHYIEEVEN
ncbi:MAG: hypothetical protein FH761_02225 [Firmicutes bacterium]|nr:hypothetical protein [Bacillota bacterium]